MGGKLPRQVATNHEPSLGIQPIQEELSRLGRIVAEDFTCDIGVDYGTHSEID